MTVETSVSQCKQMVLLIISKCQVGLQQTIIFITNHFLFESLGLSTQENNEQLNFLEPIVSSILFVQTTNQNKKL